MSLAKFKENEKNIVSYFEEKSYSSEVFYTDNRNKLMNHIKHEYEHNKNSILYLSLEISQEILFKDIFKLNLKNVDKTFLVKRIPTDLTKEDIKKYLNQFTGKMPDLVVIDYMDINTNYVTFLRNEYV